jgi:hypothetical protein
MDEEENGPIEGIYSSAERALKFNWFWTQTRNVDFKKAIC